MKKFLSLLLAMVMCIMPIGMVYASNSAWSVNPNLNVPMPTDSDVFIGKVLNAVQAAGMIVAVFILVFIGFKYLTAGAGEKAKTKEMLVPFLIGAAVLALAPAIAKWIFVDLL